MRQTKRWVGPILAGLGRLRDYGNERRGMQKLLGDDHLLRDAGVHRSDILGGRALLRMEWHQRWLF